MKSRRWKALLCVMALAVVAMMLGGCGSSDGRRIIRIGHNQSQNHPSHKAMVAFQEYINEELGDKYVFSARSISVSTAANFSIFAA